MRRLFVAIPLPTTLHEHIHGLQNPLPESVRRVRPDEAHLTLKFLGLVPEEKVPKVIAALKEVLFRPFDLRTTKIGTFSHVLWLGVRLTSKLAQLQQHVERAVRPFAMHDPRSYKPHITLARFDTLSGDILGAVRLLCKPQRWTVDSFVLFESRMETRGVAYRRVHTFP